MSQRGPLRQPLTRRRLVQLVGATAGAASLPGLALASRGARAALQTAPSGELIVAAPQDNYRADPPERVTLGKYSPTPNVYEPRVRLTPDYLVEPLLAESWEFVEPNT